MRLVRRLVDGSTLLLGKLKRRQKIKLPPDTVSVRINLGCGLAVAPGWINIDGSLNALIATLPQFCHRWAYHLTGASRYYSESEYCRILGDHRFVHHDLAYSLPLNDGVVDHVYSSHFVEHLFHKDADHLIAEAYRVLKPGGTLRISVPDLEYAVSLYASGNKERMLSDYFFVEDDSSYYARHKYMYDFGLLAELMVKNGFRNITRCSFRQGATPDLKLLDNRPQDSLFVEAVR